MLNTVGLAANTEQQSSFAPKVSGAPDQTMFQNAPPLMFELNSHFCYILLYFSLHYNAFYILRGRLLPLISFDFFQINRNLL